MAGGRRENQNLEQHMSRQMEASPRDLLRRFGIGTETAVAVKEEATAEEVELSLGLSLGGSFGVDPAAKKGLGLGLVRASSVASFSFFPQKEEEEEEEEDGKEFTAAAGAGNHHPLMRACSLPAETGEEQRKKKEMQSLRRLEAKRKREEKRGRRPEEGCGEIRHMERVAFTNGSTSSPPLPRRRRHQQHNHAHGLSPPPIACRLPTTPTPPLPLPLPLAAEVSTSSSDYDCRPMQGLDISGQSSTKPEAKSPPRMKSFAKQTEQKPAAVFPNTLTTGNSTRKMSVEETLMKAPIEGNGSKEMTRPTIEEMPCVSTDGPDGKRIEGFLCKYSKGEEVRIMCVCHGSFLSPAEFVKHAGGGDVEFPLRHIVVYPSAQAFL